MIQKLKDSESEIALAKAQRHQVMGPARHPE